MARLKRALVGALLSPRDAGAYSVLAHEANLDALWDRAIVPLLEQRFRAPRAKTSATHAPTPTAAPSFRTWATRKERRHAERIRKDLEALEAHTTR